LSKHFYPEDDRQGNRVNDAWRSNRFHHLFFLTCGTSIHHPKSVKTLIEDRKEGGSIDLQ